jgi:2,3-dimethylmalate lyase
MTGLSATAKRQRLRELLQRPTCTMMPAVYDALSAVVFEQVGFEVIIVSGAALAGSLYGLPDIGFLSFNDMLEAGRRVAAATSIPVVLDGDTGYGNALNVVRAVREFEQSGVAGVFFEDQVFPKRCGHLSGKAVVPLEEFVKKIEAAIETRVDPNFIVMARTDAIAVHGVADALERAQRCADAGADVIFVEAPETIDQVREIAKAIDVPLMYNNATGGRSPSLTVEELHQLGFKLSVVPMLALFPAVHAMREAARRARETGSDRHVAALGLTLESYFEMVALRQWRGLDARYATERQGT